MVELKVIYAGDRDISVWVLEYLISAGTRPVALLIPSEDRASHTRDLRSLCSHLPPNAIMEGKRFREQASVEYLEALAPDLIISVHFPYVVPIEVLSIPRIGALNLHPAFLPYNRGWHTPSWALLEETPIGATLHFMDTGVDTGDIVHQREYQPSPADTAHTLYKKLRKLELDVFVEVWPSIADGRFQRRKQVGAGTVHRRSELFDPAVQELALDESYPVRSLLRRLRALTTNDIKESAYFREDGKTYRVQVSIAEE
ncbi:MAG: hypothetical protein IPM16_10710 [Chloroflexi bacterium]|nr:hypothetical protein [Chloroflexota bacterium]